MIRIFSSSIRNICQKDAILTPKLKGLRFQSTASVELDLPRFSPQQLSWTCGVISATRMLNAYGHTVSLDQMISEIGKLKILGREVDIGNTPENIARSMSKYEVSIKAEYFLTFRYIKKLLAEGKPVATLMYLGPRNDNPWRFTIPALHWVVLSGFNDNTQKVTMYRPEYSYPTSMSYTDFANQWKWHTWHAFHGGDSIWDAVQTNVYGAIDNILKRNTVFWINRIETSISKRENDLSEVLHSNPTIHLPSIEFDVSGSGVTDCGLDRAHKDAKSESLNKLGITESDLFIDLALLQRTFNDHYSKPYPWSSRSCEFHAKVHAYSTKPEF